MSNSYLKCVTNQISTYFFRTLKLAFPGLSQCLSETRHQPSSASHLNKKTIKITLLRSLTGSLPHLYPPGPELRTRYDRLRVAWSEAWGRPARSPGSGSDASSWPPPPPSPGQTRSHWAAPELCKSPANHCEGQNWTGRPGKTSACFKAKITKQYRCLYS